MLYWMLVETGKGNPVFATGIAFAQSSYWQGSQCRTLSSHSMIVSKTYQGTFQITVSCKEHQVYQHCANGVL
jgi:hypothetical protein